MATQKETVLRLLTDAGEGGVSSSQFFAACLPRFSARIFELKKDGHHIEKEPAEHGFFTYHLCGHSPPSGAAEPGVSEHPVSALDMPTQTTSEREGHGTASSRSSLPSTGVAASHLTDSSQQTDGGYSGPGSITTSESVEGQRCAQDPLFTLPSRPGHFDVEGDI